MCPLRVFVGMFQPTLWLLDTGHPFIFGPLDLHHEWDKLKRRATL